MANGNHTVVYLSEQVVVLFSCTLSFLGSSVIILTYILWSDLRTAPRKLLVYLSVSDWLSAVSYGFGVWSVFRADSLDCVIQGAISTFANTSSFFWTVAIAVYLYVFIVKSSQRVADSLVLVFHLVSWGVPLVITVAAVSMNKIGYSASEVSVGWCWVRIDAADRVMWMLLTGKIWEFLAYLTLPILYILIKRHIHIANAALSEYRPILANRSPSPFSSMADLKLTLIPVIFIVLRIWSTVRFILLLVDSPARQNPVLVTLHGIGNTSQGAANCIMFVLFTQPIRTRLCTALCCCSKCESRPAQQSHDTAHRPLLGQDASTQRDADSASQARTDR